VTLNNVEYFPEICSNLFSVNKALKNGFKLTNDEVIVSLMKKHATLTFDQVIKTLDDGCVTGVMMRPILSERDMLIQPLKRKRALTSIIFIGLSDIVDMKLLRTRSRYMVLIRLEC
jgi:hypothetical protein